MEKKVLINKTIMDEDHHYYKANVAANKEAMRVLTKSGFYLYTYFMQNDDGWNPILRRTHVMKETGLSKSSYYDAIADLIEYGYLVETKDGYEFYESPEDNELQHLDKLRKYVIITVQNYWEVQNGTTL